MIILVTIATNVKRMLINTRERMTAMTIIAKSFNFIMD